MYTKLRAIFMQNVAASAFKNTRELLQNFSVFFFKNFSVN